MTRTQVPTIRHRPGLRPDQSGAVVAGLRAGITPTETQASALSGAKNISDRRFLRCYRHAFSRKRAKNGGLHAISRQQGWEIVHAASERADACVSALRTS